MATKLMTFKMDEKDIEEMKEVAEVYNITVTDLIKKAVCDYIIELKSDPYYRLTAEVEEASEDETKEILEEIRSLKKDDLVISSRKRIKISR